MAELLRKIIDKNNLYAIWQITENTDDMRAAITLNEDEERIYSSFVAENRKKQWLAYRLLLRELLKPAEFPLEYDPSGKPVFKAKGLHLSVSHTDDLAAVILSQDARVGIDIEKIKPRIAKVTEKFLSPREVASISRENELEQLTLAWCAKEALYKLYEQRELDFRENIHVDIPSCAGGEFHAVINSAGKKSDYQLFSEKSGNFILVYCIESLI